MKRMTKSFIVCSIAVLFTASSFAQPFRGQKRGQGFRQYSQAGIYYILKAKQKDFNITDSQLEKIKDLAFSLEEKVVAMRNEGNLHRLELKRLLADEEGQDLEKIRAALSKASEARQDIFIERLKTRKEIENILTPEQRDAIRVLRQERTKRQIGRGFFKRGKRIRQFRRR